MYKDPPSIHCTTESYHKEKNTVFDINTDVSTSNTRKLSKTVASGNARQGISLQIVEVAAIGASLDIASSNHEVTELLALMPLLGIMVEDGVQLSNNLVLVHTVLVQLVQPLTSVRSSKVQVVNARRLSNQGDLRHIWACAAVRASSHSYRDGVVPKTRSLQALFQSRDQVGEVPLRLSEGERARGQGNAGHRVEPQARVSRVCDVVLVHEAVNLSLVVVVHVGNHKVLVRRQTELALEDLRKLAETSLDGVVRGVLDTAVLDEQRVVPLVVRTLHPAVTVAVVLKVVGARLLQLVAQTLLDLLSVPLDAAVVHSVLETCVLAVRAVTVVALHKHHLLADLDGLLESAEAEQAGNLGVRLLVAVGHAHAPCTLR
eukprot:Colp12_sorted_trinity150504_noHs@17472